MGETDNMEDTGATLIKNGNEKVVFTKNKDLTNEEEHEVKDVDRMEEDNVSWYERNFDSNKFVKYNKFKYEVKLSF